ncbi:MAG: hypothetical protein F4087_11975 [Gemmatimonadetes bacterium]|nr:hypothetical protein [Gemmatimonadota bacterium]MYE68662.1 hypothetical protein [Gemmatimonadota bacterium]MYJ69211.1 hypothetical protein [Gemmatimonadota bacterium]
MKCIALNTLAVLAVLPAGRTVVAQTTWTATLEAESEPSLPIGRVVNLVVDSQLKVYVNDGYLDGIAVLAPNLTFEQEIGRKGEGPGEFDWPTSIQILAGDSLFVFDGGLARVTVFEPYARTVAHTATLPAINNPSRLWKLPGQRGYVGSRWLPFYATQREEDQGRSEVVFRLGRDGNPEADSLFAFPAAERLVVRGEGSVMVGPHPFGGESFLRLLGADRLVHANSRVPSVVVLDLTGSVQHSFAVPATPVPVSAAELSGAIEREEHDAFVRVLRQGAPHMWPALTGLAVDDEQRIWVGGRSESGSDEWEWTAFTQEGRKVGSVMLPAGFVVHAVRDGRLFGVFNDELDVPHIRAYRLVR